MSLADGEDVQKTTVMRSLRVYSTAFRRAHADSIWWRVYLFSDTLVIWSVNGIQPTVLKEHNYDALPIALALTLLITLPVSAESVTPREGWRVIQTEQSYSALLEAVRRAVTEEDMAVVTDIGPTETAAQRGETIPGNRVLGVFRNDFAVRAIRASVPAMIEAPIRFYVTEGEDGTATLSWKKPSHVFSPYLESGGAELKVVAEELDRIFEAIGSTATEK